MKLFEGESEPIAIDPILRGVDLALERLVQRDCFSDRTFTVIDELRDEVIAASEHGQEVVYDFPSDHQNGDQS